MIPKAVKTVREFIYWEYSKAVVDEMESVILKKGLKIHDYRLLKSRRMYIEELYHPEDGEVEKTCVYCKTRKGLKERFLIEHKLCPFVKEYNRYYICPKCAQTTCPAQSVVNQIVETREKIPIRIIKKSRSRFCLGIAIPNTVIAPSCMMPLMSTAATTPAKKKKLCHPSTRIGSFSPLCGEVTSTFSRR